LIKLDSSVSSVSDPSSVVTSAAYLLFYRRRTNGHLGGPRFAQIFEKYNSETSGEDEADSGEDDSLSRGSPLKAGATHTAIKPLSDTHDGDVPPYEEAIRSIEDEGLAASSSYQVAGPKSLDLTQSWSFSGLDGSGAEGSTAADYASDDAQFNSSGDEQGDSRDVFEADIHMTSADSAKGYVGGEAPSPAGAHEDVLTVPTGAPSGDDSDEVAEIHLEGDNTARGD
jgi:ubiquitin carboxyl-terminal hydrolase 4/11/15